MIAYLAAVFLLGFLAGGAWGFYSSERLRAERERAAFKRMKDLR